MYMYIYRYMCAYTSRYPRWQCPSKTPLNPMLFPCLLSFIIFVILLCYTHMYQLIYLLPSHHTNWNCLQESCSAVPLSYSFHLSCSLVVLVTRPVSTTEQAYSEVLIKSIKAYPLFVFSHAFFKKIYVLSHHVTHCRK